MSFASKYVMINWFVDLNKLTRNGTSGQGVTVSMPVHRLTLKLVSHQGILCTMRNFTEMYDHTTKRRYVQNSWAGVSEVHALDRSYICEILGKIFGVMGASKKMSRQ